LRGGEDDDEAHGGAIHQGHDVGEHWELSCLVMLRCSIGLDGTRFTVVIIDMAASFLDQMNIE
jgi:hypothetical protein